MEIPAIIDCTDRSLQVGSPELDQNLTSSINYTWNIRQHTCHKGRAIWKVQKGDDGHHAAQKCVRKMMRFSAL